MAVALDAGFDVAALLARLGVTPRRITADSRDVLTVCNPAATRILGQEAPVGQLASTVLPSLLATLIASWRAKPDPIAQTFEVRWPSNKQLQSVALAPLPASSSRPGWVMVLRDVSHLDG